MYKCVNVWRLEAGTLWPSSCLWARCLFRFSMPTSHLHMTTSHSSRQQYVLKTSQWLLWLVLD
ncbi:hypothetical protein LEMLEM_LOCUS13740 [Lemmus lemmus]